jgi:hypothetical protein
MKSLFTGAFSLWLKFMNPGLVKDSEISDSVKGIKLQNNVQIEVIYFYITI